MTLLAGPLNVHGGRLSWLLSVSEWLRNYAPLKRSAALKADEGNMAACKHQLGAALHLSDVFSCYGRDCKTQLVNQSTNSLWSSFMNRFAGRELYSRVRVSNVNPIQEIFSCTDTADLPITEVNRMLNSSGDDYWEYIGFWKLVKKRAVEVVFLCTSLWLGSLQAQPTASQRVSL